MKTIFMWLPVVFLALMLLFGQDVSDWVLCKRQQYDSYQSATSKTNNCVIIDGFVYDKKGRKQNEKSN